MSDEHNEQFYWDTGVIEKRYKGKWLQGMPFDDCWKVASDHLEE